MDGVRQTFRFANDNGKWYDLATGDVLSIESASQLIRSKKRISDPSLRVLATSAIQLDNFRATYTICLSETKVSMIESLMSNTTTLSFGNARDKHQTLRMLKRDGVETHDDGLNIVIAKDNRDVVAQNLMSQGHDVKFKNKQAMEQKVRMSAGLIFYYQHAVKNQDRFFRINEADKVMTIVCDGHGTDVAIDYITSHKMQFSDILVDPLPVTRDAILVRVTRVFIAFENQMRSKVAAAYSGSTIVLAVQKGDKIFFAHAGDSRAVYQEYDGGKVYSTHDHKPDDSSERERIEGLGGTVVRDRGGTWRVNGDLATSRSFGDETLKSASEDRTLDLVSVIPDVMGPFQFSKDSIYILASDGFFDVVESTEAVSMVREAKNITSIAQEMVRIAIERGSRDDITVVVALGKMLF
jgi:serine/threonine protein phosphatase PrpC